MELRYTIIGTSGIDIDSGTNSGTDSDTETHIFLISDRGIRIRYIRDILQRVGDYISDT